MVEKHQQDFQKSWAKVVAKAWQDEGFKDKLLSDPQAALKEYGIQLPPGMQCKVYENSEKTFNLILPQKPSGEITEESLTKIAAGQNSCVDCVCGG